MKRIYLIVILCLFSIAGMCQVSLEDVKNKAKQIYLENAKKTYEQLGLPVDSASIAKGLEQIDKMYPTTDEQPKDVTQTILKANQCRLSNGIIYTIGYGLSKDKTKIDVISLPLNGKVSGTTLYFNKNIDALPGVLRAVANKWREWDETAKANNVVSLSKELPIRLPKSFVSWHTSSWHFSKSEEQILQYVINGKKSFVSIIGHYIDGLNEYIDTEASYTFNSPDDLDKIADCADVNNLLKVANDNVQVNNLFK